MGKSLLEVSWEMDELILQYNKCPSKATDMQMEEKRKELDNLAGEEVKP